MNFKPSAGVFLTGLILSVAGSVLSSISFGIAASIAASRYSSSSSAPAAVFGFIGVLVAVAGFVLLCMGAYRALVKIDALPVPAAAPSLETTAAE